MPPVAPRRYERPQSNRIPEVALGRSVLLRSQDESRVRVTALGVVDPVACGSYSLRPQARTPLCGRPGESLSGCVIFEIPCGKRVGRFRYAPSSGLGPDVASWRLPGS